jgi:hypothetical protein
MLNIKLPLFGLDLLLEAAYVFSLGFFKDQKCPNSRVPPEGGTHTAKAY